MIEAENLDKYLSEIQSLVSKGKIAEALVSLDEIAKAATVEHEFIQISHRYNELRSKEIRGVLDNKELSIEKAILVERILELCKLIQEKTKKKVRLKKRPSLRFFSLIVGSLLFLVVVIYMTAMVSEKRLLDRIRRQPVENGTPIDTFSIRFPISSNDVRFGGNNPLPKGDLALVQFQSEQSPEKIPDLDIIPNLSADEYFKLGMSYRQSNRLEKALAYFTRSILEDKSFINAYLERGVTNRILGRYEDALDDYSSAIAIDESIVQIYVNRSVVYFLLDMYDLAEQDCRMASQLDDTLPELHLSMGNVFLGKKMYQEAIFAFEKALELRNLYGNAIYGLTYAYYSIGNKEKYCGLIRKFRKLDGSIFTTADSNRLCESKMKI